MSEINFKCSASHEWRTRQALEQTTTTAAATTTTTAATTATTTTTTANGFQLCAAEYTGSTTAGNLIRVSARQYSLRNRLVSRQGDERDNEGSFGESEGRAKGEKNKTERA
jgi:hypothetical protein